MLLIADSGSTKTNWCLIDDAARQVRFTTEGYNPNYVTREYLLDSLRPALPGGYDWSRVRRVYFYGAGCSEDRYDFMRETLRQLFVHAEIEIAMDLLASARALLGTSPGFVAILGTGTNSCLYDGRRITHNIDSLGFILGDEGSGGYIGKRLLSDYIRGYMPEDVRSRFYETYRLSGDEIIEQVYTRPMPNRFCASFTRFISGYDHPYLQEVVRQSFRDFFTHIICGYPQYSAYRLHCVGSVAYHFRDLLASVAAEYRMELGEVVPYPMERLIRYHMENG